MQRIAVALAVALAAATAVGQSAPAPDLVLLHGRVFTSDPANRWAEAVAIRGERIVAVGTTATIAQLAGPDTKRIDLGGRVVIPGINDAHTHQGPRPETFAVSTNPGSTAEDVKLAVGSAADETPQEFWLIGEIGPAALNDRDLTAASLEKAAPRRKVMLTSFTGHGQVFSAAALTALHVRDDIPDPAGGWFERDANGRITGKAFEYAGWNIQRKLADSVSDAEAEQALRDYSGQALRYGITSIQNMSLLPLARYEKSVRHADVPLRIRMIHFAGTDANGRDLTEGKNLPQSDRERPLSPISGTKWILDGTPIEQGAALRVPYHAGSDASGRLDFPPAEIAKILAETAAGSDQLLLHVVGDRTAVVVLEAMQAMPTAEWKRRRVRFEHGDGLLPDLIPLVRSLGIVVVQNPMHFSNVGVYPTADYLVLKTILKAGIPLALGSDGVMNPYLNIMLAITTPAHPSEAITREEAVEAYTRGSAFAEFAEDEKGTLAAGKLADLAVLSQDIFKVRVDELPQTQSVLTMVNGKVVFDAGVVGGDAQRQREPGSNR
jgi:predicted amidohydrolase YtcJ